MTIRFTAARVAFVLARTLAEVSDKATRKIELLEDIGYSVAVTESSRLQEKLLQREADIVTARFETVEHLRGELEAAELEADYAKDNFVERVEQLATDRTTRVASLFKGA